jgi:hypothetical protein
MPINRNSVQFLLRNTTFEVLSDRSFLNIDDSIIIQLPHQITLSY